MLFFFRKFPSLQTTLWRTETQTQVEGLLHNRGRNSATQIGRQKPINWSETGVGKELWKQGDSSTEPEKYHMTETDGDWKVSQTLKHVSVLRCKQVSAEPACGRMWTHAYWTRVDVYTEREQTDGKLTLSETAVIKIIDGLSNSSELETNIAPKPSYLGPNNIHRWIQVAKCCCCRSWSQNQNPPSVWKQVNGFGVAWSLLIHQWIWTPISKLASKSKLFKAFQKWQKCADNQQF